MFLYGRGMVGVLEQIDVLTRALRRIGMTQNIANHCDGVGAGGEHFLGALQSDSSDGDDGLLSQTADLANYFDANDRTRICFRDRGENGSNSEIVRGGRCGSLELFEVVRGDADKGARAGDFAG